MPMLIAMFLWAAGSLIARTSETPRFIGRTLDRRGGRSARIATRPPASCTAPRAHADWMVAGDEVVTLLCSGTG